MNKLIRGRIKDGHWIDEEVIWQSDIRFYGSVPDIGAGGRISFDNMGHVFLSVGVKGVGNHTGIQDLGIPWGKIHRIHDDGTPVAYANDLKLEFDLKDIEQPVVDLTPSPAVSSFIFYSGEAFPNWHNDIIVRFTEGPYALSYEI